MTGTFAPSGRSGECVLPKCRTVIQLGELVYLWKGIDRQTVCLPCAKARWGYEPSDATPTSAPTSEKASIGFDSTRSILRKLQQANANDPKFRAAGGDR